MSSLRQQDRDGAIAASMFCQTSRWREWNGAEAPWEYQSNFINSECGFARKAYAGTLILQGICSIFPIKMPQIPTLSSVFVAFFISKCYRYLLRRGFRDHILYIRSICFVIPDSPEDPPSSPTWSGIPCPQSSPAWPGIFRHPRPDRGSFVIPALIGALPISIWNHTAHKSQILCKTLYP